MSTKLQDEYYMGRIPIRPLPYIYKDKAYSNELMIDTVQTEDGSEPTFHIYVTDHSNPKKVYDLTSRTIQEAFSGREFTISVEGISEPISLHDVISYIYKRFVHIDDPTGFVPSEDMDRVTNQEAFKVLLRDINNETILPITRADAVYDIDGKTLQSKLDNMTRVSFANDYVKISYDGQTSFDITYPFANYFDGGNYMQLMIGTTIIDKSRYQIVENKTDDGKVYSATINFYHDSFENGRRIDILYIYNSSDIDGEHYTTIDGKTIANHSISSIKLERTSNSYINDDQESLATSKAVHDLYEVMSDMLINEDSKAVYCKDLTSTSDSVITVNLANDGIVLGAHYILVSIVTESNKNANLKFKILSLNNSIEREDIWTEFDVTLPSAIGAGKILKFLINESEIIPLNVSNIKLSNTRYIHYSNDGETVISFADLDRYDTGIMRVYRNGVRLFKDLDYTVNESTNTITLNVATVANENIIFECDYIAF